MKSDYFKNIYLCVARSLPQYLDFHRVRILSEWDVSVGKVICCNANDLSWIPGTHMVQGENLLSQVVLWPPHVWPNNMKKCKKSKSPFVLFSVRQNSTWHRESSDFGNENIITSFPSFHSVPPLLLLKFMDSFFNCYFYTCVYRHTHIQHTQSV